MQALNSSVARPWKREQSRPQDYRNWSKTMWQRRGLVLDLKTQEKADAQKMAWCESPATGVFSRPTPFGFRQVVLHARQHVAYRWIIHPASRGVAAHTAGLFRSVRGAEGGFPPWGLPKLRIFTFPPPQAREFSLFPPVGAPQAREFSLFPPVGAPQAREFSLFPPRGLPKLGNFHFSPPWGLPKLGNFHFSPPWGLPKLGNFHFSPPWQLPKLWNFHFSLPWRLSKLRNFK